MTFCSECGTKLPAGKAFCPGCGARIADMQQQISGQGGMQEEDDYEEDEVTTPPPRSQQKKQIPPPPRYQQQYDDDDEDEVEAGHENDGLNVHGENYFSKLGGVAKNVAQKGKEKIKTATSGISERFREDDIDFDEEQEPAPRRERRAESERKPAPSKVRTESRSKSPSGTWNEICLFSAFLCMLGVSNIIYAVAAMVFAIKGKPEAEENGQQGLIFAKAALVIGAVQIAISVIAVYTGKVSILDLFV